MPPRSRDDLSKPSWPEGVFCTITKTINRKRAGVYVCIGCGLYHRRVECGGIYYCPNVLCNMCGATHWKTNKPWSRSVDNGVEILDWQAMHDEGLAYADSIEETEPEVAAAIRHSAKTLIPLNILIGEEDR